MWTTPFGLESWTLPLSNLTSLSFCFLWKGGTVIPDLEGSCGICQGHLRQCNACLTSDSVSDMHTVGAVDTIALLLCFKFNRTVCTCVLQFIRYFHIEIGKLLQ